MGRGFANGPEDRGSVPGRVISKTQKMVLDTAWLNTQHNKERVKWSSPGKGRAPSSKPWCRSWWKRDPLGCPRLRSLTLLLYVRGAYDNFPDFFRIGIQNCRRLLKIHYVIAILLMRWRTNFYDFSFKWTATAGIGIHPTEAWLSQLGNFKNAIWHFRRTICNKILF